MINEQPRMGLFRIPTKGVCLSVEAFAAHQSPSASCHFEDARQTRERRTLFEIGDYPGVAYLSASIGAPDEESWAACERFHHSLRPACAGRLLLFFFDNGLKHFFQFLTSSPRVFF